MNASAANVAMNEIRGLPTALYRAAQVRELDRLAIEKWGEPGIDLMNRAGHAAFAALQKRWPSIQRIVVVCGSGNNAGDAYVVARLARETGLSVAVYRPKGVGNPHGDGLRACDAWIACGGTVDEFKAEALAKPCVVVDGLLGTGLERDVTGEFAAAIEAINQSSRPVLALDVPSGLNADSGMPMGIAVRAEMTVTFVGLKRGLFTGLAQDYTGSVRFDSLGIPREVYQAFDPDAMRLSQEEIRVALTPRARSSHKGDNGHVLVIGGERGMLGAARLAASGAARIGAGLVSVATRESHAGLVNLTQPELMSHGIEEPAALEKLLEKVSVVAIGPGLGRSDWARSLLDCVLLSERRLVIDADALNLLAHRPHVNERWILTPHPGEAARLLDCSIAEVQSDRFGSARRLQSRYGGVVVLKGAGSVIADAGEMPGLCTLGNPGMGSGGMGDVLTGVIAGLLAQGLSSVQAARVGVYLHAQAADVAARDGERGLLATDLLPHLRRLANPAPR